MYRLFIVVLSLLIIQNCYSQQQKRNNNWVLGYQPAVKYNFNVGHVIDTFTNNSGTILPLCAAKTASCISDTSGNLLFFSSGFVISDREGFAMSNGIKVNCPKGDLLCNTIGYMEYDQSSIILPKKGNQYYVFSTGMSDSLAQIWINSMAFPGFDVLNYSVVDMDSNAGKGKVVVKNKILLDHQHYGGAALTAVRHANNKDWWLIKSDCYNHRYQKFLVKEDTILGPYYHTYTDTTNYCELRVAQIYFNEDGTKFVSNIQQQHYPNSLFLEYNRADVFDFDRSNGQFTFRNYYKVPVDTTSYPWEDGGTGICFSPDSKLLYLSTLYNIFQIDISDTNPYNAIHIHGPDTTLNVFPSYHILANGVDGKMYIGNFDGSQRYMSYIDKPNIRGTGCDFKAHGIWQPYTYLMSPPNMPSYGLGQWGTYPLESIESSLSSNELVVYPNPTTGILYFKHANRKRKELYNNIGQLLLSTLDEHMDVSNIPRGMYYIRCENQSVKVLIE